MHNLDQERRSALLDKISALLAKTEERGCSEAEAVAAAQLAQKLMHKYGLTLSELETISEPLDAIEVEGVPIGNRRAHEVNHLSSAIAKFTDTKSWYHRYGSIHLSKNRIRKHAHRGIIAVFFGLAADVHVAIYLVNTLRLAMDHEWNSCWKTHGKNLGINVRTARTNFMRGLAQRLRERLAELKEAQAQTNNNCRSIVLAKTRIIDQAYRAAYGEEEDRVLRRASAWALDAQAYQAGIAAGDRVSITKGALKDDF